MLDLLTRSHQEASVAGMDPCPGPEKKGNGWKLGRTKTEKSGKAKKEMDLESSCACFRVFLETTIQAWRDWRTWDYQLT